MLDGVDLAAVDVKSWHRHLAVLSQEFLKYEFATAAENIFFGDVGCAARRRPHPQGRR